VGLLRALTCPGPAATLAGPVSCPPEPALFLSAGTGPVLVCRDAPARSCLPEPAPVLIPRYPPALPARASLLRNFLSSAPLILKLRVAGSFQPRRFLTPGPRAAGPAAGHRAGLILVPGVRTAMRGRPRRLARERL
jgi:hypothetical protein